ncbi:MAG: hypothetical protein NDI94_04545 [Candidatus Woesearchaeota archaeon]|nr:hypothetical protein [Candidatus Woesearchaeota archaeon]
MGIDDDLPKSVLVVLVLLAVLISVLGTFTVLHEMQKYKPATVYVDGSSATGRVSLEVQNPNRGVHGKISLNLEKSGGN